MAHLDVDNHHNTDGCCLMEWVDLLIHGQVEITLAGPVALTLVKTACPPEIDLVVARYLADLNDVTPDEERDQLIWFLPRILRCRHQHNPTLRDRLQRRCLTALVDTFGGGLQVTRLIRGGAFDVASTLIPPSIEFADLLLTTYEKGLADEGLIGVDPPLVDPELVDAMIASVLA